MVLSTHGLHRKARVQAIKCWFSFLSLSLPTSMGKGNPGQGPILQGGENVHKFPDRGRGQNVPARSSKYLSFWFCWKMKHCCPNLFPSSHFLRYWRTGAQTYMSDTIARESCSTALPFMRC
jgi:hypothetical protein